MTMSENLMLLFDELNDCTRFHHIVQHNAIKMWCRDAFGSEYDGRWLSIGNNVWIKDPKDAMLYKLIWGEISSDNID